jgi:hypothetical protein
MLEFRIEVGKIYVSNQGPFVSIEQTYDDPRGGFNDPKYLGSDGKIYYQDGHECFAFTQTSLPHHSRILTEELMFETVKLEVGKSYHNTKGEVVWIIHPSPISKNSFVGSDSHIYQSDGLEAEKFSAIDDQPKSYRERLVREVPKATVKEPDISSSWDHFHHPLQVGKVYRTASGKIIRIYRCVVLPIDKSLEGVVVYIAHSVNDDFVGERYYTAQGFSVPGYTSDGPTDIDHITEISTKQENY